MTKAPKKVSLWELMDLVEADWRAQHGMRPLHEHEKASVICEEKTDGKIEKPRLSRKETT